MENVDNLNKIVEINENVEVKNVTIKPHQGLNESNLMTLPFVSLKRKKVLTLERTWIKDGNEVGLKVVGSGDNGCPTMYDVDVLLALFRILTRSIDNKYAMTNNKVEFPKVINFTYRELAKEMNMSFSGNIKKRLEKSIKTLNETTLYSTFAFRNQEEGKYVKTYKGEESFRILKKYKAYSIEERKRNGDKLANARDIKSETSVEIDDFFFNNICNNYFKLYDYNKYVTLTSNIAKKMLLILTQWSHGYEKLLNIKTVYDYVGIDIESKKDEYYYNAEIKKALEELKEVGFIQDYVFNVGESIRFIFNATMLEESKGFDKYLDDNSVVHRLHELGVSFNDITKYCRMDTMSYISALLRYTDHRVAKGTVVDTKKFIQAGLPYGKYDVSDYEINI